MPSATEFWGLPLAERAAAFALLRAQQRPRFFAEPESPFSDWAGATTPW